MLRDKKEEKLSSGKLSGRRQFLAIEGLLDVDEKCSLFHLKSFFRFQDI